MKCPKCGYNSFDHQENCKKCGVDLADHKGKFGLRSLFFPQKRAPESPMEAESEVEPTPEPGAAGGDEAAFGFDFMSEAETDGAEESSLDDLLGEAEEDRGGELTEGEFSLEGAEEEPAPLDEPPFDDENETDQFAASDESLDFDMDWNGGEGFEFTEEPASTDTEPGTEELPEKKKGGTGDGEGDEQKEEPHGPFEQGGDGRDSVSPEDESRVTEPVDGRPSPEEETPDLASLFLDSLEGEGPQHDGEEHFAEGLPEESLPPLAPEQSAPPAELPELQAEASCALSPETTPTHGPESSRVDDPEDLAPSDPDTPDEPETPPTSSRPVTVARLGAGAADLLVLALLFVLFLSAGKFALYGGERTGLLPSVDMLAELAIPYFLVLFALCFGYFTLFHFLTGQTPGKMLFGLRVETEEGSDLLLSQAFLRSVGGLLSTLAVGLGYLRIFFDPLGRGWNDRLAGSRVVTVGLPPDCGDLQGEPLD